MQTAWAQAEFGLCIVKDCRFDIIGVMSSGKFSILMLVIDCPLLGILIIIFPNINYSLRP